MPTSTCPFGATHTDCGPSRIPSRDTSRPRATHQRRRAPTPRPTHGLALLAPSCARPSVLVAYAALEIAQREALPAMVAMHTRGQPAHTPAPKPWHCQRDNAGVRRTRHICKRALPLPPRWQRAKAEGEHCQRRRRPTRNIVHTSANAALAQGVFCLDLQRWRGTTADTTQAHRRRR